MSRRRASLLLAVLLAGMAAASCGGDGVDAETIDDPGFTAGASRACGRALPPLRPDLKDRSRTEPHQVAEDVEDRAAKLDAMVDDLEALPVVGPAEAAVEAWLADWRAYIEVGHAYARSLRSEDAKRNAEVAARGVPPQRRISAFARANDMKACALDGQPLPPREGL